MVSHYSLDVFKTYIILKKLAATKNSYFIWWKYMKLARINHFGLTKPAISHGSTQYTQ